LKHPYITRKKGVCGGKPIIAGTRIKVTQIAIEYEMMGLTADQIIEAHPHLTLAQIHDALSYYYESIEELNAEIKAEEQFVEEMKKLYPSKLRQKRGDK
jgi:uncharacterized protein (DUF433 family)